MKPNSSRPEYKVWNNMIQRCHNPNNPMYQSYGKKGRKVCEAWKNSFQKFINDMGERPSNKHTLDRIDNNGNYEPSNCRWTTWDVQIRHYDELNRKCPHCGYEWHSRIENPKKCPSCIKWLVAHPKPKPKDLK